MPKECVYCYCARQRLALSSFAHQFAPTLINQGEGLPLKCDVNIAGYLAKHCLRVTDRDGVKFRRDPKESCSVNIQPSWASKLGQSQKKTIFFRKQFFPTWLAYVSWCEHGRFLVHNCCWCQVFKLKDIWLIFAVYVTMSADPVARKARIPS